MKSRGFTLIELLVAMAIFAVFSVLAMGGLNTVITQRELAIDSMDELVRLQRTMRLLAGDFGQVAPRYVRDALGQGTEPPLLTDGRGEFLVRLTRSGWRNPAQLPRGTLQRVQYRLVDGELLRDTWLVLDPPLGTEPRTEVLLEGVEEMRIEYLEGADSWSEDWPPLRRLGEPATGGPRAARITLTLDRWGEIERLVEMLP
jgi:general secretion pathway protein J